MTSQNINALYCCLNSLTPLLLLNSNKSYCLDKPNNSIAVALREIVKLLC